MKFLLVFLWPLLALPAFAAKPSLKLDLPTDFAISADTVKRFAELGGSLKALKHLSCILKNHKNTRFGLKEIKDKKNSSSVNRCNRVEGGKAEVSINREDYALVMDFTRAPTARRMFLIPLSGNGAVEAYYTGHGRFGNTPRDTTKASEKSNSIDTLKFFSNKPNSNATATGLFIAGKTYVGKYDGPKKEITKKNKKGKKYTVTVRENPKDTKYSLVLHGVEPEVNDNACNRATVIHGTTKISESGKEAGVHLMSSGCPMVDYKAVNHIVEKLKGASDKGGAPIFAFGPREAALGDDYYCEMRPGQKPDVKPEDGQDDEASGEEDDQNDEPVKTEAPDPLDQ